MSAAVAVEAKNVSKIFGTGGAEVRALDNVSVTIRQNEFFTLLGPSGCGKTTLLRMIAGFEMPSDGSILLEGEEVAHLPPFKRHVNTVFQSYALFPHMTVSQNIAFGLEMLGKPKAEVQATVTAMLKLVRMEELKDRRTSQISGGQQQRVALARALAPKPKVLLLDEPLSALDLKLRKEMQIELKRMQMETGITFIFVTHDQEEALSLSDRIAVMARGKVLQIDTAAALYERPNCREVAGFIGNMNFLEGRIASIANGVAAIEIAPGQHVRVPATNGAAPGQVAILAVRPEKIDAAQTAPAGTDNVIKARALAGSYLGDRSLLLAEWREGAAPISVSLQNRKLTAKAETFTAETPLWLTWPVEAGVLLNS